MFEECDLSILSEEEKDAHCPKTVSAEMRKTIIESVVKRLRAGAPQIFMPEPIRTFTYTIEI